jgi:hypothetical protein
VPPHVEYALGRGLNEIVRRLIGWATEPYDVIRRTGAVLSPA